MRSLMRPTDYFSDEVFERELNSIFKSLWILAAIKPMLSNDGAFRTTSLGGTPIALRNCGGTIRAFLNVCRHRGARLHQQEFGSRPLGLPVSRLELRYRTEARWIASQQDAVSV